MALVSNLKYICIFERVNVELVQLKLDSLIFSNVTIPFNSKYDEMKYIFWNRVLAMLIFKKELSCMSIKDPVVLMFSNDN
jgi:hypothetical protein